MRKSNGRIDRWCVWVGNEPHDQDDTAVLRLARVSNAVALCLPRAGVFGVRVCAFHFQFSPCRLIEAQSFKAVGIERA